MSTIPPWLVRVTTLVVDLLIVSLVVLAAYRVFGGRTGTYPRVVDPAQYRTGPMLVGDTTVPVSIVVWSDYQCPFCERLAYQLDTLHDLHPDSLQVRYHHLTGPSHLAAATLGAFAQCAAESGQFRSVHLALYAIGRSARDETTALATALKLLRLGEQGAVSDCIARGEAGKTVRGDTDLGLKLGIGGTPAILVGDRLVTGAPPAARDLWDSLLVWQ